jgi:hypothetical protein
VALGVTIDAGASRLNPAGAPYMAIPALLLKAPKYSGTQGRRSLVDLWFGLSSVAQFKANLLFLLVRHTETNPYSAITTRNRCNTPRYCTLRSRVALTSRNT